MLDLAQNDLRAYAGGRADEPFPTVHISHQDEESRESQLDVITVLALLIVNSGLILAVMRGGAARLEGYPGAGDAVLAALWSLQVVITILFFVVVARWLKS